MFNQKNEKDKILTQIINVSKNIKYIYDNMNAQNKDSLEKELKLEIAKEDLLLESLNINENNSKEIYLQFVNILNESLLNDFKFELKDSKLKEMFDEYIKITNNERNYTNDLILTRFESYLIKKFKSEPTKSKEIIDNSKRRKEDRATIKHAAVIDYLTSTVRFLTELEETTTSLAVANKAIQIRNKNLLVDKLIEEKYINDDLNITKYDECINNGFKKEYVDAIFKDFITEAINDQGRHCYLYNNESIKNKKNNPDITIDFQMLKASLYLLDEESLRNNTINFELVNKNSPRTSAKLMTATMYEVINLKENEKQFIKTKKVI